MIEPIARANLVRIAKAYAKATGSTVSAVSRKFYGKAAFLDDFGAGKQSITLSNLDRVLGAFRENWPKDAPWPATAPMLMEEADKRPKRATAGNGTVSLFGAFQTMAAARK